MIEMVEKLYDKYSAKLAKKIGEIRDPATKIVWRCNCGARFDDHPEYAAHVNNCSKRDRYKPKYCSRCGKYQKFDTDLKRYCEHMRC
jgi:hypothetical protein